MAVPSFRNKHSFNDKVDERASGFFGCVLAHIKNRVRPVEASWLEPSWETIAVLQNNDTQGPDIDARIIKFPIEYLGGDVRE